MWSWNFHDNVIYTNKQLRRKQVNKVYKYMSRQFTAISNICENDVLLRNQGFRTKIGGLELFLKLRLSIARALSSDTSFELAALIPNFKAIIYIYVFRFFSELVLPVDAGCQIS